MKIIEILKEFFENRGFLMTFSVIAGWIYTGILAIVLIFYLLLCTIRKIKGSLK